MNRVNHLIFISILSTVIVTITPLPSAAVDTITLAKALNIAFGQNPSLAASRSQVDAARAKATQAASAYLPQVSATAGYDHTWRDGDTASTRSTSIDDDIDNYGGSISVSQLIYDFGKTQSQMDKSRYTLEANKINLETVKIALVRDVKNSFFETLKNQHLVGVDIEALAVKKRHLEQARALYKQGMRPKIDMVRGEVEVSKAELSLLQARYALQKSKAGFEKLLGGPPVSGKYTLAEEEEPPVTLMDLNALKTLALKDHPYLKNLSAQIYAAEAVLGSTKQSRWPSLNASGTFQYAGSEFPLDDVWKIGAVLKWDLFTGYRKSGEMKEYQAELRRLNALLSNIQLTVGDDVTQAYLRVYETKEAIKTAQTGLKQAKENLDMSEGRYAAGVSNAVELSDAQVLYTESRSALVQASYDHLKALAGLEYAVGGNLPTS